MDLPLNTTGDVSGCRNLASSLYKGHLFYGPYPNGTCWPIDPSDGKVQYFGNYGYNPVVSAAAIFVAAFSIATLVHLALWLKSRRWWLITISLGGLGEVIGQVGRLLSSQNNNFRVPANNYFLTQIICLTIAPAFFSAACYGTFTIMISLLSEKLSRIRDRWLVMAFVSADVLSLVLQAAGGGIAAGADTQSENKAGTNIMLGGIAFQLGVMVIFFCLYIDYFYRAHKAGLWAKTTRRYRTAVFGIAVASILIIIRGCYRTPELAQGWSGFLITHENYFLCLDAVPMVLCMIALAVCHPAYTLPTSEAQFMNSFESRNANMEMQVRSSDSESPMNYVPRN